MHVGRVGVVEASIGVIVSVMVVLLISKLIAMIRYFAVAHRVGRRVRLVASVMRMMEVLWLNRRAVEMLTVGSMSRNIRRRRVLELRATHSLMIVRRVIRSSDAIGVGCTRIIVVVGPSSIDGCVVRDGALVLIRPVEKRLRREVYKVMS